MTRVLLLLAFSMLALSLGNIFMKKGMTRAGSWKKAILNPQVLFGVFLSTLYFFSWLIILSWADVSFALPLNSIQYPLVTLLALGLLKEKINRYRWMGVGLITLGAYFMVQTW